MKKTTAFFTAAALLFGMMPVSLSNTDRKAYAAQNEKLTCTLACGQSDIPVNTTYSVMVRLSGKFITADASGNLKQYSDAQEWLIRDAGDGFCKFCLPDSPDMVWTISNGNGDDGNQLHLEKDTSSSAQRFLLKKTDDAWIILAECSIEKNTTLDVYDISYDDGAIIDQWNYWGGEGQKFYIRPFNNQYQFLRGDMNFDGYLDAKDLTLLKRGFFCGMDDYLYQIADMNADKAVNADDAMLLSDYLCGKNPKAFEQQCFISYEKENIAYLFAYFLGNAPEQEQLSYAVSLDGYHFNALNGGRSVWKSSVGTECLRDPYIFKGEDGLYHLLATDMKSSLGWSSNRNLLSAKSTDLVHWFDEYQIEIANKYPTMMNADRAWAPQAIYDSEKGSYMIYFAARVPGTDDRTVMYYAYSKDLKHLDSTPTLLFAPSNGNDAIDSDIVFQNGKYYMYWKNETTKGISVATADHANGPYTDVEKISGNIAVEGPNIYQQIGSDKWLLMSDAYTSGYYVLQETTDMIHFQTVDRSAYSFDFTPRHGYVIPINADQYQALISAFPSSSVTKINTKVEDVRVSSKSGSNITMPETINALYSDGSKMPLSVSWDSNQLASLSNAAPGTYTVKGKIQTPEYANPFIKERADPFITKGDDGYYYFTASYPAYGSVDKGYDRIILRRSKTVAGLAAAEEKTIWKAHSSGVMSKHIWAPELHYIGGAWYIYFAAGRTDDIWAIRPYVLRCDGDPYNGTWTECGQMQASNGDTDSFTSFSLDTTYFECNGKHYVIWAEIKGDSSLFIATINPSEPWKLTSKSIMLTKPEFDWEKVNNRVNEGASVLQVNGKVYLFFSASGTGSEYCIGRMEADMDADLMNLSSWTKLNQPVLQTANLTDESGPGHNSFVIDENGVLLLVYHARPASHAWKECGSYQADPLYDPCRHTRLMPVTFDANGTPILTMDKNHMISSNNQNVTAQITIY